MEMYNMLWIAVVAVSKFCCASCCCTFFFQFIYRYFCIAHHMVHGLMSCYAELSLQSIKLFSFKKKIKMCKWCHGSTRSS